ncbi:hypothetical protein EYF80_010260 [Liparis tanakae]|uniref:Uncharacterized protein n=1 Tax=Liparis tanakae TaxID=230148 RepID=A0A4Z2INJ1_9TELE|nr:hypothetical protein EYF80_010260 [Liparis tanakae]
MRVSSIFRSVTSATACFSVISLASNFEQERILTAVSSSRMLPSEEESTSKILSSISFSCLTKAREQFNTSGLSRATTIPSSWSWMPSGVIMKFRRVTYRAEEELHEEKAKVGSVFDGGVSEADAHGTSLFEGLPQQQRLQDGVQLLSHILQQH